MAAEASPPRLGVGGLPETKSGALRRPNEGVSEEGAVSEELSGGDPSGPFRSAWPALCSPPSYSPATGAASAPVTDKTSQAGRDGAGTSARRGLPRAPVLGTANSGPHSCQFWLGTARHSGSDRRAALRPISLVGQRDSRGRRTEVGARARGWRLGRLPGHAGAPLRGASSGPAKVQPGKKASAPPREEERGLGTPQEEKKEGSRDHPISNRETTYHGQCSGNFGSSSSLGVPGIWQRKKPSLTAMTPEHPLQTLFRTDGPK
nr:uncharacterized protein LOC129045298 [Pongo pygmaeus]